MPTDVSDNVIRKLDELVAQYESVSAQLLDPEVIADHRRVRTLSIKRAAIEELVQAYRTYRQTQEHLEEMESLIRSSEDDELIGMAREEIPVLRKQAETLMESIQKSLVTAEDQCIGAIILEIRAGVGGDEAALWAGDLVNLYQQYAQQKRWTVEELQASPSDHGGFKLAMLHIAGEGVWAQLGYEGGTHQVKRVPATEAQGRIHTSTATVAVLPEPEEIEVVVDANDVKEMITTSQGPGGQNVNKVATAVHLIHGPSGIEVRMQDTKSQAQNRQRAWQLLRVRLYEQQREQAEAERAESRKGMIGSANRAEKIRTYRYRENLVVDHRLGESFNLGAVMAGSLQPMIDRLIEHDTAQRLAAL